MVISRNRASSRTQAIQAATIHVAKSFRKDKDFGSVEPGKYADIIAVEGDPLQDMWAVHNVRCGPRPSRTLEPIRSR